MTVSENRDLDAITAVMRDPDVYAGCANEKTPPVDEISSAAMLRDFNSIALRAEDGSGLGGYFICVAKGYGIYEVHTMLLPACRGARAVAAGRAGCDWMFTQTDCEKLTSFSRAKHVTAFARMVGFGIDFTRGDTTFLSYGLQEWQRSAWKVDYFQDIGRRVHEQFFTFLGRELHPDDPNHNGVLGIALSTALHGNQPEKGAAIFNLWAAGAGYQPVAYAGRRGSISFFKCGTDAVDQRKHATVAMDREFNILYLCHMEQ